MIEFEIDIEISFRAFCVPCFLHSLFSTSADVCHGFQSQDG